MIADVERATKALLHKAWGHEVELRPFNKSEWQKSIVAALLAYHRSRTPSPEEVGAVARAICRRVYGNMYRQLTEAVLDEYVEVNWRNHIEQARAALAASDAYRVKELEKMG